MACHGDNFIIKVKAHSNKWLCKKLKYFLTLYFFLQFYANYKSLLIAISLAVVGLFFSCTKSEKHELEVTHRIFDSAALLTVDQEKMLFQIIKNLEMVLR